MPNVTTYIRKDDVELWLACPNKAELIHNALHSINSVQGMTEHIKEVEAKSIVEIKPFVPKPPDPETGYPCCQKRSPCKHWHWDEVKEVWENELTGKTRIA